MSSAMGRYVQSIVERAGQEAREDGSSATEAHHLLLAIAGEPETVTHQVLSSVGLDRRAIRDALDREFERSLGSVGVATFELPRASAEPGRPRLGSSAKLAIARGFGSVARKGDLRPAHLLVGILQAPVGTVPRALDLAGIDREDLRVRVLQTLAG